LRERRAMPLPPQVAQLAARFRNTTVMENAEHADQVDNNVSKD
jgi:hypothetical protein